MLWPVGPGSTALAPAPPAAEQAIRARAGCHDSGPPAFAGIAFASTTSATSVRCSEDHHVSVVLVPPASRSMGESSDSAAAASSRARAPKPPAASVHTPPKKSPVALDAKLASMMYSHSASKRARGGATPPDTADSSDSASDDEPVRKRAASLGQSRTSAAVRPSPKHASPAGSKASAPDPYAVALCRMGYHAPMGSTIAALDTVSDGIPVSQCARPLTSSCCGRRS